MISLAPVKVTDTKTLSTELHRIAEICHGCRRCFSLCPSFAVLFTGLDTEEVDGDAEKLPKKVLDDFVDLCYECKICVSPAQCPYVPPHRWMLDIPHVVLESRRFRMQEQGLSMREKMLTKPDLLGKLSRPVAPIANFVNTMPIARWAMEKTLGVHREKALPSFVWENFTRWFAKRGPSKVTNPVAKVVLFPTCTVEWNRPEIGKAAVQVLEASNVEVAVDYPHCCGMPFFDVGDFDSARKAREGMVAALKGWVEKGYKVVTPGPSCSLMMKKEYPWLAPDDADTKALAAATRDLCEFLMELKQEGKLNTDFKAAPKSVAYHLPCHLNVQRIRFKASDLLALTGATVTTVEKCSGHDGTWAMKVEYFEESMKVGRKLFDPLLAANAEVIASDCALASVQITQGTSRPVKHPVEVLRDAYGLAPA